MGQRNDPIWDEMIKSVTCEQCNGRTDIPKDIDNLKACKCEK